MRGDGLQAGFPASEGTQESGMNWKAVLVPALLLCAAASLAAQASILNPLLSIERVIPEPSSSQVGDFLRVQTVLNPDYDPNKDPELTGVDSDGNVRDLPIYGNGRGLRFLPNETDHFYALGGTTTHDLAYMRNRSSEEIVIDPQYIWPTGVGFEISNRRPAIDVDGAPENPTPDLAAVPEIIPFSNQPIVVPGGAEVPIFLMRTRWRQRLDTSPREYYWTFTFWDTNLNAPAGGEQSVEGRLVVPKTSDMEGGCTATRGRQFPGGLLVLGAGAGVAWFSRRRLFEPRKA
jgi:hypothetical protein